MDQSKLTFVQKYRPAIIMVTGIVGLHYGWFYLQQNERLVPKSEQLTEQPIITASRKLYGFVKEKYGTSKSQ